MAKFLLDTNICIYIQKKRPFSVFQQFARHQKADIAISAITLGELHYGVSFSDYPQKSLQKLNHFLNLITILPLPLTACEHYGKIFADLRKKGQLIGNNDMWIAAHALADDLIVITNNVNEFNRVESLTLQNWVKDELS